MENALTDAGIPEDAMLFSTLDTTTRVLELEGKQKILLTDTVGFIRKLPHHLVEAFKATLEELTFADLLVHVIDASGPNWREQAAVVDRLIQELGAAGTPRLEVFNKCDKFVGDILPHGEDMVPISAKTGAGLDALLAAIGRRLDAGARRVELRLPYGKGGLLDQLYREARVEKVEYGETIEVEALCPPKALGRVREYVTEGWKPEKEFWEE